MKTEILNPLYDFVVNEYIQVFEKKQDVQFEYWASGEVGGIAVINEYFFDFLDIKRDIDLDQPNGLIFQWYEEGVEYAMNNKEPKHINYKSYIMGLRYSDLDKPKTMPYMDNIKEAFDDFKLAIDNAIKNS